MEVDQDRVCPICQREVTRIQSAQGGRRYDCVNCGSYILTERAIATLPGLLGDNPVYKAILSHGIRQLQRENDLPKVSDKLANDILAHQQLPTPREQADNLLLWIGDHLNIPERPVRIAPSTHQAVIGAATDNGFIYVLDRLKEKHLIQGEFHNKHTATVRLTLEGWDLYHELKKGRVESRKAFMAMQYNDSKLDRMFDEAFRPAVEQSGFNLVRLDNVPKAGLIDDHMRVEILISRFLIADLSHENRGAYWEAGYAEGLGMPVIFTCEKSKFKKGASHFDTNHHQTVTWEEENPEQAAQKLKDTIRSTPPAEAKLSDG